MLPSFVPHAAFGSAHPAPSFPLRHPSHRPSSPLFLLPPSSSPLPYLLFPSSPLLSPMAAPPWMPPRGPTIGARRPSLVARHHHLMPEKPWPPPPPLARRRQWSPPKLSRHPSSPASQPCTITMAIGLLPSLDAALRSHRRRCLSASSPSPPAALRHRRDPTAAAPFFPKQDATADTPVSFARGHDCHLPKLAAAIDVACTTHRRQDLHCCTFGRLHLYTHGRHLSSNHRLLCSSLSPSSPWMSAEPPPFPSSLLPALRSSSFPSSPPFSSPKPQPGATIPPSSSIAAGCHHQSSRPPSSPPSCRLPPPPLPPWPPSPPFFLHHAAKLPLCHQALPQSAIAAYWPERPRPTSIITTPKSNHRPSSASPSLPPPMPISVFFPIPKSHGHPSHHGHPSPVSPLLLFRDADVAQADTALPHDLPHHSLPMIHGIHDLGCPKIRSNG